MKNRNINKGGIIGFFGDMKMTSVANKVMENVELDLNNLDSVEKLEQAFKVYGNYSLEKLKESSLESLHDGIERLETDLGAEKLEFYQSKHLELWNKKYKN